MKWIDHADDILQRTPSAVVVDTFAAAQALPQGTTAVVRGVNFRTEDGLFRVVMAPTEGNTFGIWDMRCAPYQAILTGIPDLRRALVVGEVVARSRAARAVLVARQIWRGTWDRLRSHLAAERVKKGDA